MATQAVRRVFIGHDSRWPQATQVCEFSLRANATCPLSVTWLDKRVLPERPVDPLQSNEFTYLRFLVPWLCGYQGDALYIEQDMIVLGDVAQLPWGSTDPIKCVQHADYEAGGTKMHGVRQDAYPRKNWSSVMLLNCAELGRWDLDAYQYRTGAWLHRFVGVTPIGYMAHKWNQLDHITENDGIVHLTSGGPWHGPNATPDADVAALWHEWARKAGVER